MDNNIIKIDEENLKNDLKGVIRKTIEETLNTMLDEEAAELCNAERHERTDERRNYRSGHYHRKLLTSAGEVMSIIDSFQAISPCHARGGGAARSIALPPHFTFQPQ